MNKEESAIKVIIHTNAESGRSVSPHGAFYCVIISETPVIRKALRALFQHKHSKKRYMSLAFHKF